MLNTVFCKECGVEVFEDYIINQHGTHFCSEACLEKWEEETEVGFEYSDENHPYHFDYKTIRGDFLYWNASWKSQLQKGGNEYSQQAVNQLLEDFDEILGNYGDYVRSEGDDGAFAQEIYLYTVKFRELQNDILAWRPERYAYFGIEDSSFNDSIEVVERIWAQIYLNSDEAGFRMIQDHAHRYHAYFDVVFSKDEHDMDETLNEFQQVLAPIKVEVSAYHAALCDGGCGDHMDLNGGYWDDGWLVCDSCKENKCLGGFSKADLVSDLVYYEENPDELARMLGTFDFHEHYKSAIRRACKEHDVDVPDWAIN